MISLDQFNQLDLSTWFPDQIETFDEAVALDDNEYLGGLWDIQEVAGITLGRAAEAGWEPGYLELLPYDDESRSNISKVLPELDLPFVPGDTLDQATSQEGVVAQNILTADHKPGLKVAEFTCADYELHSSFNDDICTRIEMRNPKVVASNVTDE